MKFRYKFLLFILLLALPALACGGDDTSTNTNGSNPVEIPSPTRRRPSVDPTSRSTPVPEPDLPVITINGARVNIRSGPGTNYPVIQTLDKNETVPATGFNSGKTWVRIKLPNGRAGWVSADLVDIDNFDEISIVSNIPPAPDAATSSQQPPSADSNGGSSSGNSGDSAENSSAPVATTSSQQPPSADNTGGSSGGNSGGNSGNAFQCAGGCAIAPDSSCAIKGNVNSNHEKIYHVPSGASYDRTDIKPEEGDRWFCTTAEAEAAGFRPSAR